MIYKRLKIAIRIILITSGAVFLIMLALSFTEQPFWAYYWLGTHNSEIDKKPDYIVVMGAGGMPSPTGLMRCYYAAKAANIYPYSKVIIVLPTHKEYFHDSHAYHMYKEIQNRGIDSTRFMFEINGINTRTQAIEIAKMIPQKIKSNVLIITSPDHMLRSILCFRKVGFTNVGGNASFENSFDESLLFYKDELGEQIKSQNSNVLFRYNMWNYLIYEISVIREFFALSYYKLRGWI